MEEFYDVVSNPMTITDGLALLISSISLFISIRLWNQNRKYTDIDRKQKFYQHLISGFESHNWKFVEHWENTGIRPFLYDTFPFEQSSQEFGSRVVVFDHLFILLQVFIHKDILEKDEIDAFRHWAQEWFLRSFKPLAVIFDSGDIFPIEFIIWLEEDILGDQFKKVVGKPLKLRIEKHKRQRKRFWSR